MRIEYKRKKSIIIKKDFKSDYLAIIMNNWQSIVKNHYSFIHNFIKKPSKPSPIEYSSFLSSKNVDRYFISNALKSFGAYKIIEANQSSSFIQNCAINGASRTTLSRLSHYFSKLQKTIKSITMTDLWNEINILLKNEEALDIEAA
jgi:hypothetical protein